VAADVRSGVEWSCAALAAVGISRLRVATAAVPVIAAQVRRLIGVSLSRLSCFVDKPTIALAENKFPRESPQSSRSAAELEFGEIYINRTLGESIHAHHAGYRESGIGGEDGKWGLLRYTQVKTAYHHYG
jgi:Aldehyde dehydrogenase family